jgi:2-iminobutanoate/2-iminopropanoate deaminase
MLLFLCFSAEGADRKYIVTPRPAGFKGLPFSDGVLVGDTLYVAGHIGLDAKTGTPPASAEDEARLALDEVKKTVDAAGMTMDDMVSVQIFALI